MTERKFQKKKASPLDKTIKLPHNIYQYWIILFIYHGDRKLRTSAKNIITVLKQRLEAGEYVDSLLPSERELATEFSVARLTIRRALDTMLNEGHLHRMENGRLKHSNSTDQYIMRIGYFYPSLGSWNYELQYLALREIAGEFKMKICPVYYDFWNDPSLTEGLDSVDAVILHPRPNIPDWLVRKLQNCRKPIWVLGYNYSEYGFPSLTFFPDRAVNQLLDYLAGEGFKDIDLVNITPLSNAITNRITLWESFLDNNGGKGRFWDFSLADEHLPFCELRDIMRNRIQKRIIGMDRLVLCTSFPGAAVFLRAAADLGLFAGKDYSLASIDCEAHAEMTVPTITAMDSANPSPYFRNYLEWLASGKPWEGELFREARDCNLIPGDSIIRKTPLSDIDREEKK